MCIATSSLQNMFAKSPIFLFVFYSKLADKFAKFGRGDNNSGERGLMTLFQTGIGGNGGGGNSKSGDKRKYDGGCNDNNNRIGNDSATRRGNDGGSCVGVSDRSSSKGSIINTSGQQMKMHTNFSKKYCGHFMDTELRCNFGGSCKKEYAPFLSGFHDSDITPMLAFVKPIRGSRWVPYVQLPTSVSCNKNRS